MPFIGGHILPHNVIGPDLVNWPKDNSKKNNGSAPKISMIV